MKTKKFIEELNHDSVDVLHKKLDSMRRELFRLKINVATAHVKDYSEFKKGRRNIARVMTLLRQKASM
jgi:ribosomal protein L29